MSDYPDFSVVSLLKGFYGGQPTPLTLDANGYIIALLSGLYGGNPTGLQCDVNGNININLKAQELAEIIQRNKYGAPQFTQSNVTVAGGDTESIISLSGQGIIYNALLYCDDTDFQTHDKLFVYGDGNLVFGEDLGIWYLKGSYASEGLPVKYLVYDTVGPKISLIVTPMWTIETSYEIKYQNLLGNPVTVQLDLYYALI